MPGRPGPRHFLALRCVVAGVDVHCPRVHRRSSGRLDTAGQTRRRGDAGGSSRPETSMLPPCRKSRGARETLCSERCGLTTPHKQRRRQKCPMTHQMRPAMPNCVMSSTVSICHDGAVLDTPSCCRLLLLLLGRIARPCGWFGSDMSATADLPGHSRPWRKAKWPNDEGGIRLCLSLRPQKSAAMFLGESETVDVDTHTHTRQAPQAVRGRGLPKNFFVAVVSGGTCLSFCLSLRSAFGSGKDRAACDRARFVPASGALCT